MPDPGRPYRRVLTRETVLMELGALKGDLAELASPHIDWRSHQNFGRPLVNALGERLDELVRYGVLWDLLKLAPSKILHLNPDAQALGEHAILRVIDALDAPEKDAPTYDAPLAANGQTLAVGYADAYLNYHRWYFGQSPLTEQPDPRRFRRVIADAAEHFFGRYPLLRYAVETTARHFRANILAACRRVDRDWDDVNAVFLDGRGAALERIDVTDSDPHKGGQQVLILRFRLDGQARRRVVYKPGDVEIDYRLVGCNSAALRQVLARGGTEYPEPSPSAAEVLNELMPTVSYSAAQHILDTAGIQPGQGPTREALQQRLQFPTYLILPRLPGSRMEPDGEGTLGLARSYGYLEFLTQQPERAPEPVASKPEVEPAVAQWIATLPPGELADSDWIGAGAVDALAYSYHWGKLAALAWLFRINDVHMENVIVHDRAPHPIDVEFAFNQRFDSLTGTGIPDNIDVAQRPEAAFSLVTYPGAPPAAGGAALPAADLRLVSRYVASTNQLYLRGEDGAVRRVRPTDREHQLMLVHGFRDVLFSLRLPERNRRLREWLQGRGRMVVRFTGVPTQEYVNRRMGFLRGMAQQPVPQPWTANARLVRSLFGNAKTDRVNYDAGPHDAFPSFALSHPDHDWASYLALDIPSNYRRVGERSLHDARGRVVRVRDAATWQDQWIAAHPDDAIPGWPKLEGFAGLENEFFREATLGVVASYVASLEQKTEAQLARHVGELMGALGIRAKAKGYTKLFSVLARFDERT